MADTTLTVPVTAQLTVNNAAVEVVINGSPMIVTGSATLDLNTLAAALAALAPPPPAFTESLIGTTIVAPSTAVITDNTGVMWGINAGSQVTIGGVADTTTASVAKLYYGGKGVVYQENTQGLWWNKTTPTATWLPTGGTPIGPIAGPTGPTGATGPTGGTTGPTGASQSPVIVVDGAGNLSPQWGGQPAPANQLAGAPGGNWNSNFSQSVGTAPDGGKALLLVPSGSFPIWLPHPCGVAGYPMGNGIAANLTGCTKFQMDVCPNAAGVSLQMCLFKVSGAGTFVGANTTVNDTAIQDVIPIATNLPANVFTTITVTLSSLGLPDNVASASMWIYKLLVQMQVGSASLYIRNAKFV